MDERLVAGHFCWMAHWAPEVSASVQQNAEALGRQIAGLYALRHLSPWFCAMSPPATAAYAELPGDRLTQVKNAIKTRKYGFLVLFIYK